MKHTIEHLVGAVLLLKNDLNQSWDFPHTHPNPSTCKDKQKPSIHVHTDHKIIDLIYLCLLLPRARARTASCCTCLSAPSTQSNHPAPSTAASKATQLTALSPWPKNQRSELPPRTCARSVAKGKEKPAHKEAQ